MGDKFKIGETVRLKSGGPPMTVTDRGADDEDAVWCKWFNDGNVETSEFPAKALEKVSSANGDQNEDQNSAYK